MAWLPFVASFRRHLNDFKRRNNKRGIVKKKRSYKKYKHNRYQVGSKVPQFYFTSYGASRRFKDKDPDYSDSCTVDKKGNVTRIPWWADDRE